MMPLLYGMVVLAVVLANCVESDTPPVPGFSRRSRFRPDKLTL